MATLATTELSALEHLKNRQMFDDHETWHGPFCISKALQNLYK